MRDLWYRQGEIVLNCYVFRQYQNSLWSPLFASLVITTLLGFSSCEANSNSIYSQNSSDGHQDTHRIELPAPNTIRETSSASEVLSRSGSDYNDSIISASRVEIAGQKAIFSPRWEGNQARSIDYAAYAPYVLCLPYGNQGRYLKTLWSVSPLEGDCWLGLGNQLENRWDWYACTPGSNLLVNDVTPYLMSDGSLVVVVVVTGNTECLLDSLSIEGQLPSVTDISPTFGMPGNSATFTADVSGSAEISYIWDFGGGTVPNTSESQYPEVYFGAVGVYSATLTLTNPLGSTSSMFELAVGYRPPRWKMFGNDHQHSRRSPYLGLESANLYRLYSIGNAVNSSPAIGWDNTVGPD